MYNPKYDIPLAVGLSLAIALIATYVAASNTANSEHFVDGALLSAPDVPRPVKTTATDNGIWLEDSGMVYSVSRITKENH